jgi:hypothetical protein
MKLSFQQWRRDSLGDVAQQKIDMDSYNDNNKYGAHIQVSFNFDACLEELEQPGDYPQGPPEEEES